MHYSSYLMQDNVNLVLIFIDFRKKTSFIWHTVTAWQWDIPVVPPPPRPGRMERWHQIAHTHESHRLSFRPPEEESEGWGIHSEGAASREPSGALRSATHSAWHTVWCSQPPGCLPAHSGTLRQGWGLITRLCTKPPSHATDHCTLEPSEPPGSRDGDASHAGCSWRTAVCFGVEQHIRSLDKSMGLLY